MQIPAAPVKNPSLQVKHLSYRGQKENIQKNPLVDPNALEETIRRLYGDDPPRMPARPQYQQSFSDRIIDDYPIPCKAEIPKFTLFSGEDSKMDIEHIIQFAAKCSEELGINE
ncbi:uncharacterized protein LOC127256554 isoform X2 [Andrographis paniculata]|nr:uncharacterized protein LOC127256554 isoform X2 [Andrographis paniculata]